MGAGSNQNSRVIRQGTSEDFDAAAALSSEPELLRSRWQLPSFDPSRHLWLADGAFGALYAPDEAVVLGNAAQIGPLLEQIEARARQEKVPQLASVIPERDESAWRAYERSGFTLATEVLKLEVTLDAPPLEEAPPAGVTLRTYGEADAHAVRELLDAAYLGWDETYVPLE